jgi:hypothetical protein
MRRYEYDTTKSIGQANIAGSFAAPASTASSKENERVTRI